MSAPVPLEKPAPEETEGGPAPAHGHAHAHRFWSARRVPAAFLAALLLAGAGVLLYDVVAVRAHHPAMAWRRRLAHELATRPLDDPWVTTGAALAVVLGLWLIVLALTPGRRRVLPMRRDTPDVRAGLDRRAAALVLRDRAMEVPGVQSVRVDVTRRRVRARARSHFRDLDEVRTDVGAVLAAGVRELGLAREPSLSVHVHRPAKR
ncbi:hypothetical protein BLA24_28675 [Streptomyces cinnamoneus]|uniref:DUF6286 domain-containing protein n=1 Tax=Streptomyces cinnamoneus TaxID=53446 RepID=A0A2G1XBR0_STRCJ|nr:DUF6286 domain-containing protein [Streptomyces cinnamoneus]PHQ48684.1 hypothetical protein BLA24_28675 [Streptomyces cinnamoneus]PPT12635.1 hypothetical protein CYQ11_06790 [Streptomyces cinnamoneus]